MKLEIDFIDATDSTWEHFRFRQEGMLGMKLPGAYLPEFVEALENSSEINKFCIYENFFIAHDRSGATVTISTKPLPLLQLSIDQRAKLIAHLRSAHAALISVYR